MDVTLWVVSLAVAALAALNAVAWGLCVREVGDPQLSLGFLVRLVFNVWFILAMASAFIAAILSYIILRKMGVLAGRFFLSLQLVATILACVFVLREKISPLQWLGIILILTGVALLGR